MNRIDENAYLKILHLISKIKKDFPDIYDISNRKYFLTVDEKLRITISNFKMIHSYYGYIPMELEILTKKIVENMFWDHAVGRGYIHYIFSILEEICNKRRENNIVIL